MSYGRGIVMRWLVICLVAGCGRLGFDGPINARSEPDGGGGAGDDATPSLVIGQQAYVKASNTNAGDAFGVAVALSADGSTMAIGALGEASPTTGVGGDQTSNAVPLAGAVYVFTRSGATWSQQAYIKASNTNGYDKFGSSAALSSDGSLLAVGAPGEASGARGINGNQGDNSARDAGAVYVFARSGAVWTQTAYLKASNTDAGDQFGGALALDGDGTTLAVGAMAESSKATGIDGDQTDNSATGSGAVYVFERAGSAWSQQAYIKASNAGGLDGFGSAIALSDDGTALVIGAPGEASSATGVDGNQTDNSFQGAGAVYLFSRAGASWTQHAYIKASNTSSLDGFGGSVALSGDGAMLAIGATHEQSTSTGIDGDQLNNDAMDAGAVYVFSRSTGWAQLAYVKASNTNAGDQFGDGLALNGDGTWLIVGARGESSSAKGVNGDQTNNATFCAGAAYRFARPISGWMQVDYLKASNPRDFAELGAEVALSRDGSTIAIAAPREPSQASGINGNQTDSSAPTAGAVYMFR